MKASASYKFDSLTVLIRLGLGYVLIMLSFSPARALTPWPLLINTNNVIVVTNPAYGAVGDGVFTNTAAFQNAINAVAAGGITNGLRGGLVEIPPGTFLCGPLTMKSNVRLQLDSNSVIRLLPYGSWPGAPYTGTVSPLINGSSLTNIAVTGLGMIDGQGSPWWPFYKSINRPLILSLQPCSEVWLQDFTSSNPPVAHIALKGANAGNISIIGVKLLAPSSDDPVNPSHNTDGVDFAETNALFQDCFISTGDDNIAIGSSGSVSKDMLVTNCFFGEGHGLSIGSYTSGGVSNLTVVSCVFSNTGCGIKLKSSRDRGGLVQNLKYYNLTLTNVDTAILLYAYYEFGQGTLETLTAGFFANFVHTNANPVPYNPPIYRNITVSNVIANLSNAGQPPVMMLGLPDHLITNVVIQSARFVATSVNNPQIYDVTNVQFVDCTWSLPSADRIVFWDAGVTFTNSSASTNLMLMDGLTTNGLGNTLEFDNARASFSHTNALAGGALTLAGSTLTVSNSLALTSAAPLNVTVGTNSPLLAVHGNLTLGGLVNLFAAPGFSNGVYTVMTCSGSLGGNLPDFGATPPGYAYSWNTNTAGQVNLVTTLLAPTNLVATATNLLINLKWNAVAGSTSYSVKRGTTSNGPYPTVYSGATATNFADASVTNAVGYYYVVTATGAGGESSNSLQAAAVPLPSNQPANLSAQISSGKIQLTWPDDHLGWRLQAQTNGSNLGLGTDWVTVPGSTNSTSSTVFINQSNASVFLRLTYP